MMSDKRILDQELESYNKNLPSLLKKDKGKYALVHKTKIVGIFDTEKEAVEAGYDKIGLEPFLVKEISEVESVIYLFTSISNDA